MVTAVSHLYQHDPCRVLFPRPALGDPPTAVLLMTSGGLAGGDRIEIELNVGADAAAVVTSQAAEKVYRSLGPATETSVTAAIAAGGWLEWLPQETILFDGARLRRSSAFDVAPGGRLLAADMFVFGRLARGERFRRGSLIDRWCVRRDGKLRWIDACMLDGDLPGLFTDPTALGGAEALATIVFAGDAAADFLLTARDAIADAGCRAGATLVNGLLLARLLGPAAVVRTATALAIGCLREAAAGLPRRLPRVWYN